MDKDTTQPAPTLAEKMVSLLEGKIAWMETRSGSDQQTIRRLARQTESLSQQIQAQVLGMHINRAIWDLVSNINPASLEALERLALMADQAVDEARGREVVDRAESWSGEIGAVQDSDGFFYPNRAGVSPGRLLHEKLQRAQQPYTGDACSK